MSTPAGLIDQAFINIGSIVVGESVTTAEQADAFTRLQQMWQFWSTERAMCFTETHQTLALVAGQVAYTAGPGGSMNVIPRPERLTSWTANSGKFRNGGLVVSIDEYNAQAKDALGTTADVPSVVGADAASPLINIRVFPIPGSSPATLELTFWTPLTAFTGLTQVLSLPPGYEEALHWNLAVELYPLYGRQSGIDAVLAAKAQNAKAAIIAVTSGTTPQVAA